MNKDNKFDKLIDAINNNNSNADMHREQHKCIWGKVNESINDINILKDELHSNLPGRKGLFFQMEDLRTDLKNGFKELKIELESIHERNLKKDAIKTFLVTSLSFVGSGGVYYVINILFNKG